MRKLHSTLIAAVLAAFSYAPLHANAVLFDDEEARRAVLDLRTKVDAIQREQRDMQRDLQRDIRETRSSMEAKADKTGTLDLINQNEQLRQEIAKMRGALEVLTNELANTQQRQKDFYVDLDNRVRKMEPQKVTVDGKEADVEPAEQRAYDAALNLFKASDYARAAAALIDFQRRYPQSGYSASAQYWLGNAYYAQRDYRNAITAQQAVLTYYPNSPKAPDALLNIASCYTELKDKLAARKALESLVDKFPESSAARTAKDRLVSLK